MAEHWSEQRERSNHFWLSLLAWSALHLGRGFLRLLCFPIALFYLLTAADARRYSRQYLARVLTRKPSWVDVFRHFYTFALVSGDRLLLLAGRSHQFQLDIHGEALLKRYASEGQGCLLLVSHVGSFDAMRVPGVEDEQMPVQILIDKQHNDAAMQIIEKLNPALARGMIDASRPSAELVLKMDECLKRGAMVGIMADRAGRNDKLHYVDFLGSRAGFPVGPWMLGMVLKVPVLICFAVYHGKNRYSVHFEQIAAAAAVPRADREQAMADNIALYVSRLEHYTRAMPYNWFNFYNFWLDEPSTDH